MAGGQFTTVNGSATTACGIAEWNGVSWQNIGNLTKNTSAGTAYSVELGYNNKKNPDELIKLFRWSFGKRLLTITSLVGKLALLRIYWRVRSLLGLKAAHQRERDFRNSLH